MSGEPPGPGTPPVPPAARREPVPFAQEECVIALLAEFETTLRAGGVAWRTTSPAGPRPVRQQARRHGGSRLYVELLGLRAAASEAAAAGCRGVVVRTTDPRLVRAVEGTEARLDPRARAEAARIRRRLTETGGFRLETVRSLPDPEVARAAAAALDSAIHQATERRERRAEALEEVIARARGVHLRERDGEWVANGRYRVRLDPPSCDCPAWSRRWSRVPIAGRRASRLLCKHLVALATRQGMVSADELDILARRAPP